MTEEVEIFNVWDCQGFCFPGFHNYEVIKKINFHKNCNAESKYGSKMVLVCKNCGKVKTISI